MWSSTIPLSTEERRNEMKRREEQQEPQEHTLIVNVNLTRGVVVLLTLTLLTAAFLGYLAWGEGRAVASSLRPSLAASSSVRQYYLTTAYSDGDEPLGHGVCAGGYHFASLWEILDPSNLEYNSDLGQTRADSGSGPPSYDGWVRTGYSSNNSTTAGQANCSVWTTTTGYGTRARVASDWTGTKHMHVWFVGTTTCNSGRYVWCVED
jgi:hypothetical protein